MAMVKVIACQNFILTKGVFPHGWPDYSLTKTLRTFPTRYNLGMRTYRITAFPGELALFSRYYLEREPNACGRTNIR